MPADTTPLAQRLRHLSERLIRQAAISTRPGQLDVLEAMAAELSGMAVQLDEIGLSNLEAVKDARLGFDLFAALLLRMPGNYAVVESSWVEKVRRSGWQVEVNLHPDGYRLDLVQSERGGSDG